MQFLLGLGRRDFPGHFGVLWDVRPRDLCPTLRRPSSEIVLLTARTGEGTSCGFPGNSKMQEPCGKGQTSNLFPFCPRTKGVRRGSFSRCGRPWERKASLFSGDFAFALVDLEEGLVYLDSDPFGHQTLYYAPTPDRLFFATKILLILKNSYIKRRANPDLLYIYLRWGLIPAPGETFFRGIYRVPPGFVYVARIDHPENGRLERFIPPPLEEPEGLSF